MLRNRREASFVTMATTIAAVLHPAELEDEAKHSIDRAIISDDFNARATTSRSHSLLKLCERTGWLAPTILSAANVFTVADESIHT